MNIKPNNRFSRAFRSFGSAVRVSNPITAGQVPSKIDLETLGVDVKQFRRIRW